MAFGGWKERIAVVVVLPWPSEMNFTFKWAAKVRGIVDHIVDQLLLGSKFRIASALKPIQLTFLQSSDGAWDSSAKLGKGQRGLFERTEEEEVVYIISLVLVKLTAKPLAIVST
jgi:hypothetical protein